MTVITMTARMMRTRRNHFNFCPEWLLKKSVMSVCLKKMFVSFLRLGTILIHSPIAMNMKFCPSVNWNGIAVVEGETSKQLSSGFLHQCLRKQLGTHKTTTMFCFCSRFDYFPL